MENSKVNKVNQSIKKNIGQDRFMIHVGHHDNHIRYWNNHCKTTNEFIFNGKHIKKTRKFIQPNKATFDEALVLHYQSSFSNANEIYFIKKGIYDNKSNIHIIIYYTYRATNTTTIGCKFSIYIIAAAATINISDYSGSILYLSASPYDFSSKEDL